MRIDPDHLYKLLEKMLVAHAPPGAETEMDALVYEIAAPLGDAIWRDAADNIIIHIKGKSDAQPVAALSHVDEIALIVKRVDADGKIIAIRCQTTCGCASKSWAAREDRLQPAGTFRRCRMNWIDTTRLRSQRHGRRHSHNGNRENFGDGVAVTCLNV